MKKYLLLWVFATITMGVFAQSLLWKISGKNLKEPSYFYGTIHIQDQRVFSFDSTVVNAINACDAFAAELILDQLDVKDLQSYAYMPKGNTLSSMLSKSDFALLDSLCKAKLGVSAIFFNSMKPFFLYSSLQQTEIAKDYEDALDLYLIKKARANGKDCYGLENFIDQIMAIDKIQPKEQLEMLTTYLHNPDSVVTELDTMLLTYLSFDLDAMQGMTDDASQNFQKVLVNKRNITMVDRFVEIAQKQSLFAAVGAAHLGGKKGVLALLKKRGYTVEPIVFHWTK